METTDDSILSGIKREKDEEIGADAIIKILPYESYNLLFRKKDGSSMIIPHVVGLFQSGKIVLSDEYSEYKWVLVNQLDDFEPKIPSIPKLVVWAAKKLSMVQETELVEI